MVLGDLVGHHLKIVGVITAIGEPLPIVPATNLGLEKALPIRDGHAVAGICGSCG